HLRQLSWQELRVSVVARAFTGGGRNQRIEGLQEVLDVVRQASAGFVGRLQVGGVAHRNFAALRLVELADDARKEPDVQHERGRERVVRIDDHLEALVGEGRWGALGLAEYALA